MINGRTSNLHKVKSLIFQLERWESHIVEALEYSNLTHSFDDIVNMIMSNRVLFFSYNDAFIIMEKVDYPQFSVFHCFLAGGDMQAIIDAEEGMMEVGQKLGCKYLSIAGRKGWLRVLEQQGWKHLCSTMYKPIEELSDEQRREGRGAETVDRASRRN